VTPKSRRVGCPITIVTHTYRQTPCSDCSEFEWESKESISDSNRGISHQSIANRTSVWERSPAETTARLQGFRANTIPILLNSAIRTIYQQNISGGTSWRGSSVRTIRRNDYILKVYVGFLFSRWIAVVGHRGTSFCGFLRILQTVGDRQNSPLTTGKR
jgi:hypothetical protein